MREFGRSDFETFFQLIGTVLIPRKTDSYMCTCPFGENHASGRDKHPSMSVIYGGITSGWKCFGCNDSGSIRTLAKKINEQKGDSRPLEFIRSFDDKRSYGERAITKGTYEQEQAKKIARMYKKADKFNQPVDEDLLKDMQRDYPLYFIERGVTKQQILKWGLGYDHYQNRAIVPIFDIAGKLAGVSGRTLDNHPVKWRHYPGFRKELVLYGENHIDITRDRCYLVEGFFDVLNLDKYGGKNILATMGTSLSEYQMQKLYRYFKEIIFIPDGEDVHKPENAGLKFAEVYSKKLLIKHPRVGIAGVRLNSEYVFRGEKPQKWEKSDYEYEIIEPLYGNDPSDLDAEKIKTVLQNIQWTKLV